MTTNLHVGDWVKITQKAWEREFGKKPYDATPRQIEVMPANSPFDRYYLLTWPYVWWKREDLEAVSDEPVY